MIEYRHFAIGPRKTSTTADRHTTGRPAASARICREALVTEGDRVAGGWHPDVPRRAH